MTRDPSPIRGEVIRQVRSRGTANPRERNLRARLRHAVAEDLRGREYDAEHAGGLCQGECSTAPGSTRGGRLLGDGTASVGIVACDEHGDPLTDHVEAGEAFISTRPCIDCNADRYRAWLFGRLSGDKKRKRDPGPADRAAKAEQHRRESEAAYR